MIYILLGLIFSQKTVRVSSDDKYIDIYSKGLGRISNHVVI